VEPVSDPEHEAMLRDILEHEDRERRDFHHGRKVAHEVIERYATARGRLYRRPGGAVVGF
jgi:hypothetical protein